MEQAAGPEAAFPPYLRAPGPGKPALGASGFVI